MTADFGLTGKVALVTGASSGIGRRQALALAQAGAVLVLLCRRKAQLQQAVAEIEAVAGRAVVLPADLGDRSQIASLQSSRAFPNGPPYGASKDDISQLTRAMAEVWSRHGITCNAIARGFFSYEVDRTSVCPSGPAG